MSVCCECCVLSGRGLCDDLITRPEESYRLWRVVVCDQETSWLRRPWPALGRSAKQTNKATTNTEIMNAVEINQPGRRADSAPTPTYPRGPGFDYSSTPLYVYIVWPLTKDRAN
jgi:hypothetical protein